MHKLIALLIAVTAAGCVEDTTQTGGIEPDTTAADTSEMADDSLLAQVTQVVAARATVARTPNGKACLFIPDSAVPEGPVEVSIRRLSRNESILPSPEPPAFRGRDVLPPMYEFTVRDADGQAIEEFADPVTYALCVMVGEDFDPTVRLARPHPDSPEDSLDYIPLEPVPAECRLTCEPHSPGSPAQRTEAASRSLLGASPAYASSAQLSTMFSGIGGKGRGTSPIAGVRGAAGRETGETAE
jgi:hypothetical protein